MPTTTYVPELTEQELAVVCSVLTVTFKGLDPEPESEMYRVIHETLESALSKLTRLMEGK